MHFIANDINLSFQKKKVLLPNKVSLSVIFMSTASISSVVSILSFSNMPGLEKA